MKQRILQITTLLTLIVMCQFAMAQPYSWNIAQSWPEKFPIYGDAVTKMVSLVNELSNGQLTINIVPEEVHKQPLGVFDLVKSGQYEMGHSASYFWKDRDINALFFSTLPMGMIASEQYAWFYNGGGMQLMQKAYAKHGILSFPGGNTGNQMGGWFQKEIKSLNDLKGLRMSIPGFAGDAVIKLGVQSVNLPAGELYTALSTGKIDALEWVGPSQDLSMGFHKIAPYYYTGWHEPATELQFMVNKKAFDSLPKNLQTVLKVAMKLSAYDMYFHSYHVNAQNLKKMFAEYPEIKVRAFPGDVIRQLRKEVNWQIDELFEHGSPLTKEIISSIRAYAKDARLWTRISDQAYLNNIGLN